MISEISKFIDVNWATVKKRLTKDEFLDTRGFVFSIIKENKKPFESVMKILFYLKPVFGCDIVTKEDYSDEEKQLHCDAILDKMNNHKIPVYISETDLNKAVERIRNRFHLLVDKNPNQGWRFAIATSFKKWAIFGRDTRNKEITLCSSETFDIGSAKGETFLEPFLRSVWTILRFDEEEVANLFDAFEKSRKPGKLSLKVNFIFCSAGGRPSNRRIKKQLY